MCVCGGVRARGGGARAMEARKQEKSEEKGVENCVGAPWAESHDGKEDMESWGKRCRRRFVEKEEEDGVAKSFMKVKLVSLGCMMA